MIPNPDQFEDFLDSAEPLVGTYTATLSESTSQRTVSIGITDRRLLCVGDEDWFIAIGHDSICAVRSRPRTTRTYCGLDYRLLVGCGSAVTLLGLTGVMTLTTTLLVPLLSLVAVTGFVSGAYLKRNADGIGRTAASTVRKRATDYDAAIARLGGERHLIGRVTPDRLVVLGGGFTAAASFIGLVLFAPSVLVSLATLVIVGGIALIDYAYRHQNDFDGFELVHQREKRVVINTTDGQTVYLWCESATELGRDLSRFATATDLQATRTRSAPS